MIELNSAIRNIAMPPGVARLPIGPNGFPIPWFVAWIDGKPEFRAADSRKLLSAVSQSLCWVCGEPLNRVDVYVVGPMCAVNRTSAEPPSHQKCAEYSVKACPFLSRPSMVRREANMPEGTVDPAGEMIRRNPGVTLLWYTRREPILFRDGRGGVLFELPEPFKVSCFCEGRAATRAEVLESIDTGLPTLMRIAESESTSAVRELTRRADVVRKSVKGGALAVS